MTQITDELVREFLENKLHLNPRGYESWQSFLTSKQAKDWEVVRRKRKIYDDQDDDGIHEPTKFCNDKRCEIWEVRRLPDNIIFSIGEVTQEGKIGAFKIAENNKTMMVVIQGVPGYLSIEELTKRPVKQKLFTTEDGKDIYNPEELMAVVNGAWAIYFQQARSCQADRNDLKYFSTRSAAEEYVREHKPQYSEAVIRKLLFERLGKYHASEIIDSLRELNP